MQQHLYEDQFSEQHDFAESTPVKKTLVIASTPRCGSHMLGHLLYQTGAFGFPLEYANPRNLKEWHRRFGLEDQSQVFKSIQAKRTSPNGVFGIKLHYAHLAVVGGINRALEDYPDPHFVILTRNDHLKQAVSYSLARQTGVWIAGQKAKSSNPEYSFSDIDRCLKDTIRDNAAWRYVLASHGCRYIHMSFEEVSSNPHASIQRVADFMGIHLSKEQLPIKEATTKQSGTLNQAWLERYLKDCQGGELFPSAERGVAARLKRNLVNILKSG